MTVSHAFRIQGQVETVMACSFENKKKPNNVPIHRDRNSSDMEGLMGLSRVSPCRKANALREVQCDDSVTWEKRHSGTTEFINVHDPLTQVDMP